MAEYIDKKQAIDRIASCYCMDCEHSNGILCRACAHQDDMDIIDSISAADVQPVKHGEWETWGYIFHGIEWPRCSRCGKPADISYFKLLEGKIEPATLSICGCCGADMRGVENA